MPDIGHGLEEEVRIWGLGRGEANRHAGFWHDYTPAEIGQPLCGGVDPRSRTRLGE